MKSYNSLLWIRIGFNLDRFSGYITWSMRIRIQFRIWIWGLDDRIYQILRVKKIHSFLLKIAIYLKHFFTFSIFVVIFALLDPDPGPQHWFELYISIKLYLGLAHCLMINLDIHKCRFDYKSCSGEKLRLLKLHIFYTGIRKSKQNRLLRWKCIDHRSDFLQYSWEKVLKKREKVKDGPWGCRVGGVLFSFLSFLLCIGNRQNFVTFFAYHWRSS